jgi:hypothetical protein
VDIFDVDSPETAQDLPGPSMRQKISEVKDLSSALVKTTSITPEQEGDGEELEEVKHKRRDEAELLQKRKGSPQKPSSRKKSKAPVTKLHTTLTLDDFNFIVAALNDVALEIVETREVKQE